MSPELESLYYWILKKKYHVMSYFSDEYGRYYINLAYYRDVHHYEF